MEILKVMGVVWLALFFYPLMLFFAVFVPFNMRQIVQKKQWGFVWAFTLSVVILISLEIAYQPISGVLKGIGEYSSGSDYEECIPDHRGGC